MKKLRILSVLLVAVLVLTTCSGALVFAEGETTGGETTGAVEGAGDTADTETAGGETTEDNDADAELPNINDGRAHYTADSFVLVDPTDEANQLVLGAAEKAAEGRAVTVYTVPLSMAMTIETGNDFVALCTYSEAGTSMTVLEASYVGSFSMYDLPEELDGVTGYVLEVASISEADITALPSMDPAVRLEWKKDKRGLFKTPEQRVRAMTKYHEDDTTILYADDELAEIALYNKTNGEYFFSTPYDYRRVAGVSSTATKSQLASLVELEYYDNTASRKTMYSFDDAVNKTTYADEADEDSYDNIQFTASAIENGVQFKLAMGTKQVDSLLPYAAEAVNFETKVLQPLKVKADAGDEFASRALRKLNAFYTRYHYDDLTSSMQKSLTANYPGLKDYDLYVLRGGVHNRDKQLLSDYVKYAEQYTWGDWDNDLAISGYVPDEQALACFEFHVNFTVEDGNLVVDMPTDNIVYDEKNFTLSGVTLLRYFGAGTYSDDGFVFVPDGSGTVINFNVDGSKTSSSLAKKVYGDDYSLTTTKEYMNLTQSAYLPVYGLHTLNRGYLAVIEKGDAMATVKSETGNKQSAYETVYASFVNHTVQTIAYQDGSKQNGEYTYFNEHEYTGGYRLRYILIYGEDTTYVDMAKAYRQYLLDNGRLVEKLDATNQNVPLVLETLGLIDKKASFLGIIYDKKIPMTTFDAAQNMLTELAEGGVKNVSLRYRGWMNGGLNYSVPSTLKIESKLGGKSAFSDLISFMSNNNYTLFPEVDFSVVRRDGLFDGYSSGSDAPKMTDRTTVTLTPRNELDNVMEIDKNYFAISPRSSGKYYKSFFKKYNKYNVGSVSLGTIGNMLYSDFSNKNATNRQEALELMAENVKTYVTEGGSSKVMVEGGNAYTYAYATEIVDIPLSDSNTFLADQAVPFMQIVLHGHVQYAGTALNLADNWTDAILKSAEYGANLHFTLSAENTRELKETVYSNYFTIDFDTWKSDVLELYTKFNTVFASLQDQEIEDHEAYADVKGVYITTYEDGTRVAVNYNRTEVTVEGKTIAAEDFIVL